MSRPFTQGDITRIGRGLRKAGFKSVRIELKPSGEIVALGSEEGKDADETDWDQRIRAKEKQPSEERH